MSGTQPGTLGVDPQNDRALAAADLWGKEMTVTEWTILAALLLAIAFECGCAYERAINRVKSKRTAELDADLHKAREALAYERGKRDAAIEIRDALDAVDGFGR
jgi:hypothetical protein